jgi:hypothetical protein
MGFGEGVYGVSSAVSFPFFLYTGVGTITLGGVFTICSFCYRTRSRSCTPLGLGGFLEFFFFVDLWLLHYYLDWAAHIIIIISCFIFFLVSIHHHVRPCICWVSVACLPGGIFVNCLAGVGGGYWDWGNRGFCIGERITMAFFVSRFFFFFLDIFLLCGWMAGPMG